MRVKVPRQLSLGGDSSAHVQTEYETGDAVNLLLVLMLHLK